MWKCSYCTNIAGVSYICILRLRGLLIHLCACLCSIKFSLQKKGTAPVWGNLIGSFSANGFPGAKTSSKKQGNVSCSVSSFRLFCFINIPQSVYVLNISFKSRKKSLVDQNLNKNKTVLLLDRHMPKTHSAFPNKQAAAASVFLNGQVLIIGPLVIYADWWPVSSNKSWIADISC